jgi:hypothetical protein
MISQESFLKFFEGVKLVDQELRLEQGHEHPLSHRSHFGQILFVAQTESELHQDIDQNNLLALEWEH